MKLYILSAFSLLAVSAILLPGSLSAQVVQIDFLGIRNDGSTAEQTPNNYNGPSGFADGGTVYNGVTANDLADTDNLSLTATGLVDSFGNATTTNFSISTVGADNGGIGVLNGSYLFTNSANNHFTSVPFTIGGLGSSTSEDVIFFTTRTTSNGINGLAATFGGVSATPTSVLGGYTYEFDDVAVTGGTIVGTVGPSISSDPLILSGLAFEPAAVPEPSTWAMLFAGLALLCGVQRFRKMA